MGLVVKPISGTLDFFSLTTEGIRNTSRKDEELEVDKRLRLPRPFYEQEMVIRDYDESHALWVNTVPNLNREIGSKYFYDAVMIDQSEFGLQVLFLTLNHIVLIEADYQR
jgi:hypothetical protein